MPSQSLSDRPSSTDARPSLRGAAQVAALAVLCVLVTALALAAARRTFSGQLAVIAAGVGCLAALGLAGVLALRRHTARLRAAEHWQRRLWRWASCGRCWWRPGSSPTGRSPRTS